MEMLPINVGGGTHLPRPGGAGRQRARGLQGAWMLTDPDTGERLSISLLNSEDDMHASEVSGFYHRKLSELDALFISTPVRKHYEVSVQR